MLRSTVLSFRPCNGPVKVHAASTTISLAGDPAKASASERAEAVNMACVMATALPASPHAGSGHLRAATPAAHGRRSFQPRRVPSPLEAVSAKRPFLGGQPSGWRRQLMSRHSRATHRSVVGVRRRCGCSLQAERRACKSSTALAIGVSSIPTGLPLGRRLASCDARLKCRSAPCRVSGACSGGSPWCWRSTHGGGDADRRACARPRHPAPP
jgi:hypothetical protein